MSNERILVVDDDADLRESITEILEDKGYVVVSCPSGETALNQVRRQEFSLAIVDKMMPGIGGMALIAILRAEFPAMRLIMITAFATVDDAVTAMKSGAHDYLAKPFRRDELLSAVSTSLESRRFDELPVNTDLDEALQCLANPIRRAILATLHEHGGMRFMELARQLAVTDHTKINFHLKSLKASGFINQSTRREYVITPQGEKVLSGLALLSSKISLQSK